MNKKSKYFVVKTDAYRAFPEVVFETNNKRVAEKSCRDEKRWQGSRNAMIAECAHPYRPEGRTNYRFFVTTTDEFGKNKDGDPAIQQEAIIYRA